MVLDVALLNFLLDTFENVDLGKLPVSPDYPCLVIVPVSHTSLTTLEGYAGATDSRYQLDCWDTTYLGALNLADQLRVVLDNFTGDMGGFAVHFVQRINEFYPRRLASAATDQPGTDIHHRILCEYRILYTET